jgi:hypothetical protein
MGVTNNSRSVVMTASGDSITGKIYCDGIQFNGTGLTPAQELIVSETGGANIARHVVAAANESEEVFPAPNPKWIDGVVLSGTVGGTWTVIIRKR